MRNRHLKKGKSASRKKGIPMRAEKPIGYREAAIIVLLISILLPIYVENRYFNIVDAKAHILAVIFAIAGILIIGCCLRAKGICLKGKTINGLDIAMLGIATTSMLSCILSGDFRGTFLGLYGWKIGGFILLAFVAVYFFLSRNLHLTWKCCVPIILVTILVAVITVAHSMNVDFFSLHTGIAETQYYWFKSTLGNMNAHVGFVCLLFPIGLIIFADEENSKRLLLAAAFIVALLVEIVFGCTDSVYLGIGLCAFLAVPFLCHTSQRLRRVFLLIAIYGALLLCSGQCSCFAASAAANTGLAAQMRCGSISIFILIIGTGGYIILRYWPHLWERKKLQHICMAVLEGALLLIVLYFIGDTIRHFSDSWGTNRGKIWRLSLESYGNMTPIQKLFGVGPEKQQFILTETWKRKWPVYTCHSEPIQMLLSMGAVGLAAWCAAYGTVVAFAIRSKLWERREIMFILPILAYCGQSLVNSATATNLGLLCVICACCRRTMATTGDKSLEHKNQLFI